MPIYEFRSDRILAVRPTTFAAMQLHERRDLQRLLRDHLEVVSPGTLVIGEEYGDWNDSRRRIDLLGVDQDAKLVVIELKRTEDGGHMDLQAIRYAAMVSTMTFDQAVASLDRYQRQTGRLGSDARSDLLTFLGWDVPDEDLFAQEVRIVLASAEFSPELTTSVLWLNKHDLDIRCVRLRPYTLDGKVIVDVQQIIPIPEAADYQIRVREKDRKERQRGEGGVDRTKFDVLLGDQTFRQQSKRWAILRVFQYLVSCGVSPKDIVQHCGPRANRSLVSVEGEVDRETFLTLAAAVRAADGRQFHAVRFFCRDEDLIRLDGRTYAFSNQWGGPDWEEAMTGLSAAFPQHEIRFTPVFEAEL